MAARRSIRMRYISNLRLLQSAGTLLLVLLAFCTPVQAEVYQYFDDQGTLIVTDNPYGIKRPKSSQPLQSYKPAPNQQVSLVLLDDVQYDYYPVFGGSFHDVVAYINANAPFDPVANMRFAGQTRWATGWKYSFGYSYSREGGDLRAKVDIRDIQIKSDISVLLPMLSPDSVLGHHDLQLWQKFTGEILEHEHDHVKIVRDGHYRDEALRRISAIRELLVPAVPGESPDSQIQGAVEAETARIGHELIKTIKARNEEYDRLTGHGAKPEMRAVFFGTRQN